MKATVGVIVNPLAGKDIRRLVAAASPTSDGAKVGIVRRVVIGALEGGAERILLVDDSRGISRRAIDGLANTPAQICLFGEGAAPGGLQSRLAARFLRDQGAGAVVVLGGDGTSRDVAKGWIDAPMVPISTGTNNVFPRTIEATVAGHAAGLVSAGRAPLDAVARRAKFIEVAVEAPADSPDTGSEPDIALVDVAQIDGSFVGSRAVWEPSTLRRVVAAVAEPASVGISAIAAQLVPVGRFEPGGAAVTLDAAGGSGEVGSTNLRAPLAPGLYADFVATEARWVDFGETTVLRGPGVLSFDGERDLVLADGQRAECRIRPDGPNLIDVAAAMRSAVPLGPGRGSEPHPEDPEHPQRPEHPGHAGRASCATNPERRAVSWP